MSTTIESLELEILSSSQSAESGLDKLTASLEKLKTATKGGLGLTAVAKQLQSVKSATSGINSDSVSNVTGLAKAIQLLGGVKVSSTIAKQITAVSTAINGADFTGSDEKIRGLVEALAPLSQLPKNNLSSYVNSIKKLPEALEKLDTRTLYTKIQSLTRIMQPLATEMQKVANGFAVFPTRIQKLINENDKLAASNKKTSLSYTDLYSKFKMAATAVKAIASKISSAIQEMNSYIENINLFTVAMGESSGAARDFAEQIGEIMGIDPGEWMRNQGVFMTLTSGFGVATDRAALMSQQLTQLGYDLSSFFNIGVEEAMQKLQSGISGELEPLRRLGYDLSQARLEAVALSLGIDKSVSSMTQAEKAQLRYYAIMTQVTAAQGDMARTLNSPANQLRIFKAQVTQAARAIGSIFIPALNAILPYAIAVAKVVRVLAESIASIFGFEMPEVDYSGIDMVANGAEDTSDALDTATKSAKKLKSYMLGFDELNVINPNADSEGSGIGDVSGGEFNFELPTYDFIGEAVNAKVDEITKMITDSLSEIEAVVSGFALAIGTILVVTGANIPVGIGLMAVGALGIAHAIAANWSKMSDKLAEVLTTVTSVIGGFSLAIGAFLALTGVNMPLGIALMALGAVSLVTATAINWKFLNGDLENTLSILTGIVSGALLAMGALFAFTGVSVPLGIGLMVAGAVGLATAVGLNWNGMSDQMRQTIGTLEAIVGGGLLALGAVLAFTGVNVPLGVGLIAGGAVALVSAVALNWNSMSGDLEKTIKTISGILGGALLGIGAILAFTGVNIPLGVGLMAAGAVSLGSAVAFNWNTIINKVKDVCTKIKEAVSDMWTKIKEAFGTAKTWFTEKVITPVKTLFTNLWTSIKTAASNAWTGIKTVFTSVKTWFTEKVITPVKTVFSTLWTGIKDAASSAWKKIKEVFTPVKTWFSTLFGSVKKTISDVFNNIGVIAKGCWTVIKTAWQVAKTWFNEKVVTPVKTIFTNLWNGIKNAASTAWTNIKTVFTTVKKWFNEKVITPVKTAFSNLWTGIKNAASTAWTNIKTIFNVVKTWFNDKVVKPVRTLFSNLWTGVKSAASTAWTGVKNVFTSVKTWFSDKVVTPVKNVLSGIWTNFKSGASTAWSGVKSVFSTVGTFFKTTFENAWKGVVKVFSTAGNVFTNIKDGIVSAFKTVVNALIKGINKVVSVPFNAINTALTKVRDASIMGIQPFKELKTISVPSIPLLAQGGFPDAGQMFIAREAGPELVGNIGSRNAVVNNDQIVESVSTGVYQAVVAALANTDDDSGNTQIVVNLDGEKIYENQQKIARGRGYNLGMGAFSFG
jgi:pantoate kinase